MSTPAITIFVRHSAGCKYEADEFAKRCSCRKHLRWFANGKLIRRPAKTRSWAEAESFKRTVEDSLSGKMAESDEAKSITDAVALYITDKKVQRVSDGAIKTYTRELERLRLYCESQTVYAVRGITRDLLTGYMATWAQWYPSSVTQSKARERLRGFLRYGYECGWLHRIPQLPKIKVDAVPTLPLTVAEFEHLLASIPVALSGRQITDEVRSRTRALFLLMRYSGLAILDALSLRRADIVWNGQVYRVMTSRQKTGVDVSVPIPCHVAEEILAVENPANPSHLFWSGISNPKNTTTKWQTRFILPVFQAAGLATGTMMSHRLRDTFAVELLMAGVPLEEVSKLLGHSSIKTTERSYSAWVKGRQERLDALVIGTWDAPTPPTKRGRRTGRVVAIA